MCRVRLRRALGALTSPGRLLPPAAVARSWSLAVLAPEARSLPADLLLRLDPRHSSQSQQAEREVVIRDLAVTLKSPAVVVGVDPKIRFGSEERSTSGTGEPESVVRCVLTDAGADPFIKVTVPESGIPALKVGELI